MTYRFNPFTLNLDLVDDLPFTVDMTTFKRLLRILAGGSVIVDNLGSFRIASGENQTNIVRNTLRVLAGGEVQIDSSSSLTVATE